MPIRSGCLMAGVLCVLGAAAGHAATLSDFQQDHAAIERQAAQCQVLMQQQMLRAQANAMQGLMPPPQPACVGQMPGWIAGMAYDEAQIFNLQHPGAHAEPCNFVVNGCGPVGYGNAGRGGGNPDDPAGYAMHAIRGHTMYRDSAGNEYELPTRNYYFRNPNSGEVYASDTPNPPNDGRSYELLDPE